MIASGFPLAKEIVEAEKRKSATPVPRFPTIPVDYPLWAVACLGGRHPAPQRTRIGSIPMKLHHAVEEFAHGRRLLVEAQEVPEVAARFLDDPRMIVVLGPFVAGHHGPRFQRFEFVEGSDPFRPRLWIAFRHIGMDPVVG